MESMDEIDSNEKGRRRPQLLSILCVLSFIGSGLVAVSSFFTYLFYDVVVEAIATGEFDEEMLALDFFATISKEYFILHGMLMVVSFTGVWQMWNLRRSGFHLYALSQILVLIASSIYLYNPAGISPMFDMLVTTLFILLYLRFRTIME
jgi:hypothetical protein